MTFKDKRVFDPLYQNAVADEDLVKGQPVTRSSDLGVSRCMLDSIVFGVVTENTDKDRDVTILKEGGSAEAIVRAEHGAYLPGMRLRISPGGLFEKIDSIYTNFWAICVEAKTVSLNNPFLRAMLLQGNDRGLQLFNASSVVNAGRAVKLDSQGTAVTRFSDEDDFVYGVSAITTPSAEMETLLYRRGYVSDAIVETTAAAYEYGDFLKPNDNGVFVKTTTAGDKAFAVALENKTTTSDDLMIKAELIFDEV